MAYHVDMKQVNRLERELGSFARKAVPFAQMQALNDMAFKARSEAKDDIGRNMTLRNTFTTRRLGVVKANRAHLVSRMGHAEDYMREQEEGGMHHARGKYGTAIPTTVASGEGMNAGKRRRVVRGPNRMRRIKLTQRSRNKGRNRRQRNAIAINEARKGKNKRFAFLELGKSTGIYSVRGSRRKPKLRMVHSMGRKSVKIPKNPWMTRTVAKVEPLGPRLYLKRLEQQVERQRLFVSGRR